MKNNEFWKLMALQIFAEGEGAEPGEGGEPDGPSTNPDEGKPSEPDKPKYTDEDVDKIINRKFAEWERKQQNKQNQQSEAEKLANMNKDEKEKYENEQLRKQVQELLDKEALSSMSREARKMLSDSGVNVGDDIVSMLVDKDAEKTKSAVESFVSAFKKAVDAAVKESLKNEPPKAGTAPKSKEITKEDIMKIQNRAERQKLINEHMDLF